MRGVPRSRPRRVVAARVKRHAVATLPSLLVFHGGDAVYRGKLPADPDPVIERVLGSGPAGSGR